jgi:lysophospholipase L1-like esterase
MYHRLNRSALPLPLAFGAVLAVTACTGGGSVSTPSPFVPAPQMQGAAAVPSSASSTTTAGATDRTTASTSRTPASCLPNAVPAPVPAGGSLGPGKLIAAWGATIGGSAKAPTNGSVRDMAQVSLSGTAIRIRLINPDTANPLVVCAAYIGLQKTNPGAAVVPGSSRQITFNHGKPGVTLPPDTPYLYSDTIPFTVQAQQIVAVSLYLSATTAATASNATWNSSYATASGAGDETRDESGASFTTNMSGSTFDATFGTGVQENLVQGSTYALAAIDVQTTEANGAVVGLGSSTFQGYESNQDGYNHILDLLAADIHAGIPAGKRKGIVNEGLGSDSLYVALPGRFARDVFTQTGVTGVILYDINDMDPQNGQTLAQVETNYKLAVQESHAHHIRVFCSTWAPESISTVAEVTTAARSQLNAWILNSGVCDDTVDWAAVLADPNVPQTYNPVYFSDSIHPNPAGHAAMANATPVKRWFEAGAY